jgi:hypothetical protein
LKRSTSENTTRPSSIATRGRRIKNRFVDTYFFRGSEFMN